MRATWIQTARRELLEGAEFIQVIERLQDDGCSPLEAEEIVELVSEDLREERAI
jgi:hypothetical protein